MFGSFGFFTQLFDTFCTQNQVWYSPKKAPEKIFSVKCAKRCQKQARTADGSRRLQVWLFQKNPFRHLLLRYPLQSYLLKQAGGRKWRAGEKMTHKPLLEDPDSGVKWWQAAGGKTQEERRREREQHPACETMRARCVIYAGREV